jgi:phosphatidate phosphatase APP1
MPAWKQLFDKYIGYVEERFDDLTDDVKRRLRFYDPLQIVPYRSYGTPNRLYVKGRVLEDKVIGRYKDKDTVLDNLLNMYKRFESDEVPGAEIHVSFEEKENKVHTDEEGYFVLNLVPAQPVITEKLWHELDLVLVNAPIPFQKNISAKAQILIPPADAEYGIISDIDDTVIHTGALHHFAMARTVFLNNAKTRMPFAGVTEFYKALQLGRNGKRNNPFFYVSSSPWNMYDLLQDFLDLNEIPAGPLLLRDFGFREKLFGGSGHHGHKMKEIEQILVTYPELNFVLVGDSGQEDPVIYREVVRKFPGRILAIYIRDVQMADREKIAIDISKELGNKKVEMIIMDNTVEAADHAAKAGLIFREKIEDVKEDKAEDKGEKAGKEELV